VESSSTIPRRTLVVAATVLMLIGPLVVSLLTPGDYLRFQWRMFSRVNTDVRYEVEMPAGWVETELDGLAWLDRGRHTGTANLEALCRTREGASGARRLHGEFAVAEVSC
jgi:hypothetical protein